MNKAINMLLKDKSDTELLEALVTALMDHDRKLLKRITEHDMYTAGNNDVVETIVILVSLRDDIASALDDSNEDMEI